MWFIIIYFFTRRDWRAWLCRLGIWFWLESICGTYVWNVHLHCAFQLLHGTPKCITMASHSPMTGIRHSNHTGSKWRLNVLIEQLTYGGGIPTTNLSIIGDPLSELTHCHPDICIHVYMEYNIHNCLVMYRCVYTKKLMQGKVPMISASIGSTLILYY